MFAEAMKAPSTRSGSVDQSVCSSLSFTEEDIKRSQKLCKAAAGAINAFRFRRFRSSVRDHMHRFRRVGKPPKHLTREPRSPGSANTVPESFESSQVAGQQGCACKTEPCLRKSILRSSTDSSFPLGSSVMSKFDEDDAPKRMVSFQQGLKEEDEEDEPPSLEKDLRRRNSLASLRTWKSRMPSFVHEGYATLRPSVGRLRVPPLDSSIDSLVDGSFGAVVGVAVFLLVGLLGVVAAPLVSIEGATESLRCESCKSVQRKAMDAGCTIGTWSPLYKCAALAIIVSLAANTVSDAMR